jgi:hypothetical protein
MEGLVNILNLMSNCCNLRSEEQIPDDEYSTLGVGDFRYLGILPRIFALNSLTLVFFYFLMG